MQLIAAKSRFSFSLVQKAAQKVYNALYINNPNNQGYKLAETSSLLQPTSINPRVYAPAQPQYQSTKLANGVTVLTESVTVPSTVGLGVFVDVGTRDEDEQSSGALLLLKHVHLKTAITTNETVNYGIVQMSGGQFDVKYNNENIFYRVNCLSHDVIDVFSMLVDCATEPRNIVACSVGRNKNQQSFLLDAQSGGNLKFNDSIFAAAYGGRTLGNPLGGRRSNISNLSADVIQKFQLTNFTNDRIVVSATGIENHQEFVDLVSEKFNYTQLGTSRPQREAAKYIGGELRNLTDSNKVHVAFAFEGSSYKDAYILLVASEILGHEGKSQWTRRNILDKNVFVNDVQPFSHSFTDSGLFGLKLAGSASHANDIVSAGARTLGLLRNVSETDVEIAKASLRSRLARRFSSGVRRNQQITKALYYLNETGEDVAGKINAVTASSVNEAVAKAVKGNVTLVAEGGNVSSIANWDKVSKLLN